MSGKKGASPLFSSCSVTIQKSRSSVAHKVVWIVVAFFYVQSFDLYAEAFTRDQTLGAQPVAFSKLAIAPIQWQGCGFSFNWLTWKRLLA